MAYPEKGAEYRNKPAWMEREKRAEGGGLQSQVKPIPMSPSAGSYQRPVPKPWDSDFTDQFGSANPAASVRSK